jgi:hypothetical protein
MKTNPSKLFAEPGLVVMRGLMDERPVFGVIDYAGPRRKLVARFSKNSLGSYVIEFFNKKLKNKIEIRLFVLRLMAAKKKKTIHPLLKMRSK